MARERNWPCKEGGDLLKGRAKMRFKLEVQQLAFVSRKLSFKATRFQVEPKKVTTPQCASQPLFTAKCVPEVAFFFGFRDPPTKYQ